MFSPDLTVFWDDLLHWNDLTFVTVYVKSQPSFSSCFSLNKVLNRVEMVLEEMIESIKPTRGDISCDQILKFFPCRLGIGFCV